ncbi:hypothetical protein F3Y22_tig00004779pilonHSYRG00218 [Hibiscus syriacus]|uniref:Uncharacterized protein n=1 Tax=Hibiscus syriacus TaxID=106335 RepID=A0A6A3CFW5_HIBSY|nr:hypothetical protein F3Y22_tig00004779pilonHSYRG00218 [Hibiscus syriacus]
MRFFTLMMDLGSSIGVFLFLFEPTLKPQPTCKGLLLLTFLAPENAGVVRGETYGRASRRERCEAWVYWPCGVVGSSAWTRVLETLVSRWVTDFGSGTAGLCAVRSRLD